jgi:hypothetical protein
VHSILLVATDLAEQVTSQRRLSLPAHTSEDGAARKKRNKLVKKGESGFDTEAQNLNDLVIFASKTAINSHHQHHHFITS